MRWTTTGMWLGFATGTLAAQVIDEQLERKLFERHGGDLVVARHLWDLCHGDQAKATAAATALANRPDAQPFVLGALRSGGVRFRASLLDAVDLRWQPDRVAWATATRFDDATGFPDEVGLSLLRRLGPAARSTLPLLERVLVDAESATGAEARRWGRALPVLQQLVLDLRKTPLPRWTQQAAATPAPLPIESEDLIRCVETGTPQLQWAAIRASLAGGSDGALAVAIALRTRGEEGDAVLAHAIRRFAQGRALRDVVTLGRLDEGALAEELGWCALSGQRFGHPEGTEWRAHEFEPVRTAQLYSEVAHGRSIATSLAVRAMAQDEAPRVQALIAMLRAECVRHRPTSFEDLRDRPVQLYSPELLQPFVRDAVTKVRSLHDPAHTLLETVGEPAVEPLLGVIKGPSSRLKLTILAKIGPDDARVVEALVRTQVYGADQVWAEHMTDASVPVLMKLLAEGETRAGTLRLLGTVDGARVPEVRQFVPVILPMYVAADETGRRSLSRALHAALGGKSAAWLPLLDHESPAVRVLAARRRWDFLSIDAKTRDAVMALHEDPDPEVAAAVQQHFPEAFGKAGAATRWLADWQRMPEPVRAAAVRAMRLRKVDRPQLLPLVVARCQHEDPAARADALGALHALMPDHPLVGKGFRQALEETDPQFTRRVVGLCEVDEALRDRFWDLVVEASSRESAVVAYAVARCLGKARTRAQKAQARTALQRLAAHPDRYVQVRAQRELAK